MFRVSFGEISGDFLFAIESKDEIRVVISFVRNAPHRSFVLRYGFETLFGGVKNTSDGLGVSFICRFYTSRRDGGAFETKRVLRFVGHMGGAILHLDDQTVEMRCRFPRQVGLIFVFAFAVEPDHVFPRGVRLSRFLGQSHYARVVTFLDVFANNAFDGGVASNVVESTPNVLPSTKPWALTKPRTQSNIFWNTSWSMRCRYIEKVGWSGVFSVTS